jgi:hypothetical protein
MDGYPKTIISVIGGEDDVELAVTAIGPDKINAVAIDEQRHAGVTDSGEKFTSRYPPVNCCCHPDPCHTWQV